VQLTRIDALNSRRIEIAKEYTKQLSGIRGLGLLQPEPERKHVYHVYAVLIQPDFALSKEEFMWEMYTKKGIKVWSHYMPIHLTEAYRALGHGEGECPIAEKMFGEYVSIPIHPRMTEDSIQYVIDSIRELA
jgi:dTDP-4-amino-4,6-dideoxygalactose transaminase